MLVDTALLAGLLALCQWQCLLRACVLCVREVRKLETMGSEVLQVVMALTALMSLAFLCFIACLMAFGFWMMKSVSGFVSVRGFGVPAV